MGGCDFTERDRAVLDLLRLHLAILYASAQVRRRARDAFAQLERTDSALVVIDRAGKFEYATPEGQRLIRAYFRELSGGLPVELAAWLLERRRSEGREPLKVSGGDVSLLVHLVHDSLFLEEHATLLARPGASARSSTWLPRARPTPRSPRRSGSRPAQSASTSRTSTRSSESTLEPPPSRPSMARDSSQREIFRGRRILVESASTPASPRRGR